MSDLLIYSASENMPCMDSLKMSINNNGKNISTPHLQRLKQNYDTTSNGPRRAKIQINYCTINDLRGTVLCAVYLPF